MVPRREAPPPTIDVTAAMEEKPPGRAVRLPVFSDDPDPFAEVEV